MSTSSPPERVNAILSPEQAGTLLSHWLGKQVTCDNVERLEGGICSAVFALSFGHPPYSAVVKLQDNPEDDPLPRERARLDYLHQHTNLPCPNVYLQDCSGEVIPYSFLLIERLPGVNLESAQIGPGQREAVECELAAALLELHSHKGSAFGDSEQKQVQDTWAEVFLPDLCDLRKEMDRFLPITVLNDLDRVLPLAEVALRDQGEPTLVHNDVWAGNIMVHQQDDGWHLSGLLDPVGLQYADVEKELAYLQAFDTVGETFFAAYTAAQPLRPGYEFRRLFYWLQTYMLHVWLGFGAEYQERLAATATRVLLFK
jgi:fructosamine-3-kinase